MTPKHIDALITNNDDIDGLEEIKNNFLFFLANTADYIYFKDKNHRLRYASNAFAILTGHQRWEDLVGKDDFDIFPTEHAEAYFAKEKAVIRDGKELLSVEEPDYNLEGKLCWVSSSKRPILDDAGNIVGLFGISRDITKIKELEHELSERAHTDSLTKVASRLYFLEQAESLLSVAKRNKQSLAFFYIDLDGFKQINDQYGHHAGDTTLIAVAKRFSQRLRGSDMLGRIGGDEFAIVSLTDCAEEALTKLAAELLALANEPIEYNSIPLRVSCSIGIASFPTNADSIHVLMTNADEAMYRAKTNSKANTMIYQANS